MVSFLLHLYSVDICNGCKINVSDVPVNVNKIKFILKGARRVWNGVITRTLRGFRGVVRNPGCPKTFDYILQASRFDNIFDVFSLSRSLPKTSRFVTPCIGVEGLQFFYFERTEVIKQRLLSFFVLLL